MIFKSLLFVFHLFFYLSILFCSQIASSKALSLSLKSEFLKTSENFTETGENFVDLEEGKGSFIRISEDIVLEYTSSLGWGFIAGAQGAYGVSDNGIQKRSRSQITKAYFGFSYMESFPGFTIESSALGYYPFETLEEQKDLELYNVLLSEYDLGGLLSLDAIFYLGGFYFLSGAAYNYRNQGRAHLAHWKFYMQKKLKRVSLSGGVEGFKPITVDSGASGSLSQNTRIRLLEGGNAGSFSFYSINPEQIRFVLKSSLRLKNCVIEPGYKRAFYGKNSAKDEVFFVNLSFFISNSKSDSSDDSGFSIEKEHYNRILFD